jgi:hypothetical protein
MVYSRAAKALTAVLGFALAGFSSEKKISVADWQFATNPRREKERYNRWKES